MIATIEAAWGWTGLKPRQVIDQNAFGNLIVASESGEIWRICPEELSCTKVTADLEGFERQMSRPEDVDDWEMKLLVSAANDALGPLNEGQCYCLKIPAVLGGSYSVDNMGKNSVLELVAASGDMARQIKDRPDGSKVRLVIRRDA